MRAAKVTTLASIAELQKEIAQKKMEASRAHRRKAQLDSDLKEYKVRVAQHSEGGAGRWLVAGGRCGC